MSGTPCRQAPDSLPVAYIEILDVKIVAIFLGAAFETSSDEERIAAHGELRREAERQGFAGEVALVWKDLEGRKQFMAEAAQRPFFEGLRYDQLYAQINRTLSFPRDRTNALSPPEP